MQPLVLNMYVARLGEAGAPLHPRIESEIANHLGFVDRFLAGRQYLVGDSLTGADIQMSFVGEVAGAYGRRGAYPSLEAWIQRLHARPAFQASVEKAGPYELGR
jgi:glutathione S-transferase